MPGNAWQSGSTFDRALERSLACEVYRPIACTVRLQQGLDLVEVCAARADFKIEFVRAEAADGGPMVTRRLQFRLLDLEAGCAKRVHSQQMGSHGHLSSNEMRIRNRAYVQS